MWWKFGREWEFYRQFIEHSGVPMRIAASDMHQQLRIALTAQCDIFNDTFRVFDAGVRKKKAQKKAPAYRLDAFC
jgi:hypothetical protein